MIGQTYMPKVNIDLVYVCPEFIFAMDEWRIKKLGIFKEKTARHCLINVNMCSKVKCQNIFVRALTLPWVMEFQKMVRQNVALKNHIWHTRSQIKLMKGKALRKHILHEKTAASVVLKLFISSNEWCHTTDAP